MSTWIAGKGTIPSVTTNADILRAMNDEELAEFLLEREINISLQLAKITGCTIKYSPIECYRNLLHWLKQEASQ